MKISQFLCGLAMAVLGLTTQSQASVIYLTDGDSSIAYAVDLTAGTFLGSFQTFSSAYPIAVTDTIRLGHRDNGAGQEYDLDGSPTGVNWPGGSQITQLLDGTTDGSTYNFAVSCCDAVEGVYRFDRFWGNAELLFSLPSGGSGITYDPTNGTIWVTLFDGTLREFDLAGTQLNSFSTGVGMAALAYDPSLDSFWTFDQRDTFTNFDRSGNVIGSVVVSEFPNNNLFGGEIAMSATEQVPEPATFALGLLGLAGMWIYRRRAA